MKTENSKFYGKHALLVVDNEINGMVTNAYLVNMGLDTRQCGGLEDTLLYLKDNYVDVVVLDVEVSDINNGDICTEVRKLGGSCSKIPIVAIINSLSEVTKKRDIASGMSEHISKPIKANDLSKVLWDLLENNSIAVDDKMLSSASDTIPKLEGVDVEGGLDRLQNNWELYKKLLLTFRDSNQTLIETMRNHIKKEEFSEAQRLAHTLKGTSGNLSVDEVYYAAAALEKLCKEENTSEITPLLKVLESLLNNVIEALDVLNDVPNMSTIEVSACKLTDQELCDNLKVLMGYFRTDLGKVNESIDLLNSCLSTSEFLNDFSKMKVALDNFDIGTATISANEILSPIIRRIQTRKTG